MIKTAKILSSEFDSINFYHNSSKKAITARQLKHVTEEMSNFLEASKGYVYHGTGEEYWGPEYFSFYELSALKVKSNRIEFLEFATEYSCEGIFCYSLAHEKYALYDSQHRQMSIILEMDFDLFKENPALYINAQWKPQEMEEHGIVIWSFYT